MDFQNFKITKVYPTRATFVVKYFYKSGKLVAEARGGALTWHDTSYRINGAPDITCVTEVDVDQDAFNRARDEYFKHVSEKRNGFKAALIDDLGIKGHPKAEMLVTKAMDLCSEDDLEKVYDLALSLVELIK